MLVKEVKPGQMVLAHGWDIAVSNKNSSQVVGYLIPHGMNHKRAVEMGHSTTLLYIGPTRVVFEPENVFAPEDPHSRKMHSFLTDDGSVVALEGYEFRNLSPVK